MKYFLLILILLTSLNIVNAQIDSTITFHVWAEKTDDYSIPNEFWKKLKDSKLYDKLGAYVDNVNLNKLNRGDYVIKIYSVGFEGIVGRTSTLTILRQGNIEDEVVLVYRYEVVYTALNNEYIDSTVDFFIEKLLKWYNEYY